MKPDSFTSRRLASVLATGQQPSRLQRHGRYTPASMRHPGKMLPAIASTVIQAFTRPGDLVIDPMCGIGTTLVEAIHLGRDAAGVEYEPDFIDLTLENLCHARAQGATGRAQLACGDARNITTIYRDLHGRAALVLTSPPYGSHTHGHLRTGRDNGGAKVTKFHHRYSTDRGNLAHQPLPGLLTGFGCILAGSATLLRPGGVIAVTARPIRIKGDLIDLPGQIIDTAHHHGLALTARYAALIAGLRDGGLVNRASFFQMLETRRARDRGIPACAISHEDLLLFQRDADLEEGR
ncbi:TRM11 family SAM-dependent methyltransferase [Actinomadura litoris]|uniref:TRM11 family SAM-dependent methyltransferase n=1 Tax=Actinomadura litoris TaxID=2678616 RepID=UPI001FA7A13E|nr:DNA methyltransferase [Actinomadura litoris]